MPRKYPPKQIWACPVCSYELHSPIRISGATCKERHPSPDKRIKNYVITELVLVREPSKEEAVA